MKLKLKFIRLITIGNNFIGSIAGLLGALGLFNLFTDSSLGLGTRGSNSTVLSISSGEEIFVAFLVAGISGLYYLSLDRIQDDENLSTLFYHVLDKSIHRFIILTVAIVCLILWVLGSEDSLMEIILSSTPISFFAVIYLLVISTSFLPGFVLKFSTLNLGSKKINTVEDQLLHLKELRDRDLITEDEYNKKRQSIIENI